MRGTARLVFLGIVSLILLAPILVGQTAKLTPSAEVELPFPAALVRPIDLDRDGAEEIVVIGQAGEVRVLQVDGTKLIVRGEFTLPEPTRSIVDFADMNLDGRGDLLVASPAGVVAYCSDASGNLLATPRSLAPTRGRQRAAFDLRTGSPRSSAYSRDLNGDGAADVVIPLGDSCEIWLHHGTKGGEGPCLRRVARVPVQVRRIMSTRAEQLSDVLESTFYIPRLAVRDVNADQREDLLIEDGRRRAWHLQTAEGTIPPEPTVKLDLALYRDTTDKAQVRPGRVLAGGDDQIFLARDLDQDGIEDAVIAHRRKVWVFRGGAAGPQFTEPSQILNAADDITALLLSDLDPDGKPDLVMLKVLVPDVASLLLGALTDLEVEVGAVGYRSLGATFEKTPAWRRDLVVRLPPILSILKDPAAIISRFEAASAGLEPLMMVDLDRDGRPEVVQPEAESRRVQIWMGAKNPDDASATDSDAILRQILFGEESPVWDLDRIVEWVARLAQSERVRRTGPRSADLTLDLAPADASVIGIWPFLHPPSGPPALAIATEPSPAVTRLTILRYQM